MMQISRAGNVGAGQNLSPFMQARQQAMHTWTPTGKRLVTEAHEIFAEKNGHGRQRLAVTERAGSKTTHIELHEGEEVMHIGQERPAYNPYAITKACNTQGGDGLVTEYVRNLSITLSSEVPVVDHVRKVDGSEIPHGWFHPY